ncbi:MAG TPA: ATP-binding protein [Methanosarcinaceae archaeon]|nr:ATP-binding protein [Methanosarcinaceae archaeon]
MSQRKFVNRKNELKFLETRYKSKSSEFIVIYGRRRVGKTELMLKFLENKKGMYFLASTEGDRQNIQDFSKIVGRTIDDDNFGKIEFSGWHSLFETLFKHRSFYELIKHEKFVIIIDEFPFLIQNNKAIPSIFQKIWELVMKNENIMLMLSGSAVSVMESEVLGHKSPLYGRRTGQWQVQPLDFKHTKDFLPYSTEDLINTWFVVGGIPEYLLKFNTDLTFWENVLKNVITKGTYLSEEAYFLLNEEFREPKNYKLIFKGIALGYNTLGEICNYTGLDKSMVSKYLSVLCRMHIVRDEMPVTASSKFKRRLYFMEEPYFNFWFRYVYPNRIDLEANRNNEVLGLIKNDFSTYSGHMFEILVTDLIKKGNILQNCSFSKIGRWWHKDTEIDIVGLNEVTGDIHFVECKWKDMSERDALKVLNKLQVKSDLVQWNNDTRKEHFVLVAKKVEGKESLCTKGFFVFDMDDLVT